MRHYTSSRVANGLAARTTRKPNVTVFEAIYENGVLRPALPVVGLSEGERVWVTMDEGDHLAAIKAGIDDMAAGREVAFEDVDARIRAKLGLPRRS